MWIDQIDSEDHLVAPKLTTPENWAPEVRVVQIAVNGVAQENRLVHVRFHPNGTSDAARIAFAHEGGRRRSSEDYCRLSLYAATARSRIATGEQM
jgi:hypothetical protein